MTGANRILTVSYGTFSCTLEGFDDPLSTLQAIAEYFRSVAAEDRYFGAAPPTPDEAMLHRIAERAVNRHAEAPIEDRSMILRADGAMQTALSPVAPAPLAASQPEPPPAATGLLAEESVAAKLQRIRAAVARDEEPAAEALAGNGQDAAPVFVAPPAFFAGTEDLAGTDEDVSAQIMAPPDHGPAPAQHDAADQDGPAVPPHLPVTLGGADGGDGELVALARERAADDVPEPAEPVPGAAFFEHQTGGQADMPVLSFTPLPDIADTLPESLPEVTAEDLPEAAGAEDEALPTSLDRALADADAAFAWDAAAPSGPALTSAVADSTPDAGNSPAPSALRDAAGVPGDWKDVLSSFEDRSEWTEPASARPPAPDLPEPPGAGAEPSAVPDSLSGERPQVLLLRAMEPLADPAIAEPDTRPAASSAFGSRAAAGQKAQGRTSLEDSARDAQDLTRLLDQANTEMDEPENRRRLLTMAHLKAAVAATEADLQSAGREGQAGDSRRLDRYHADLARAVQQHRPDGPLPSARPAPLVLVSGQRIDRPLPGGAVISGLQQRIGMTDLAVAQTPDDSKDPAGAEDTFTPALSFSEFAGQVGAGEMPELLEAAAAYTACIEKQPHFSRPHLMRHVAIAAGTGEANREDSMRSFGLLLRQGKIEKVDGGLFAITDNCSYIAQARRMSR